MLGILADDATDLLPAAVAPDDEPAVFADLLYGRSDFHAACVGVEAGGGVSDALAGRAGLTSIGWSARKR